MITNLQWFKMGGYSYYVWSSYALFCMVLILNAWHVKRRRRSTWQKLQRWLQRNT